MKRKLLSGVAIFSVITAQLGCQTATIESRTTTVGDLQQSVGYLASDALEGRGLQTRGIDVAADYLEKRFKSAGLKPVPGLVGYRQYFNVSNAPTTSPANSLKLASRQLEIGKDYMPLGMSATGDIDLPIVFANYGITAPEFNRDDYANLDVTGKAVLIFRYEPDGFGQRATTRPTTAASGSDLAKSQPEPSGADTTRPATTASSTGPTSRRSFGNSSYASFAAKVEEAQKRGAAAVIIVQPPTGRGTDNLVSLARSTGEPEKVPVVQISQAAAQTLLSSISAPALETLQSRADKGSPGFALNETARVSGKVELLREPRRTCNVVAMIPGTGPTKDDIVVIGAHYDHVGLGERGAIGNFIGQVHNGADDNASGTSAMLEVAQRFGKLGPQKRTLVFIGFSGEERGLLGSAHFVENSPFPLQNAVAMLNLDMVGRVRDNTLYVGGIGTAKPLQQITRIADIESPLKLKVAGGDVGGKGGMGPSDHASFARKRVPVIFYYSGMHPDYHRPTDDADKINYQGIADVVDLAESTVRKLASMQRSEYLSDFDRGQSRTGSRVQLGIVPDYDGDNETGGLKISGTTPNSAADQAGLKSGDAITAWNGAPVRNMDDLMTVLGKANPGDKVTLKILRDGKTIEATVTLRPR